MRRGLGPKAAIHAALRRLGLQVVHLRPEGPVADYDIELFRSRARFMNQLGTDLVLDVGANRGQWARTLRAAGYCGRLVSFEPVPEPYEELAAHAAHDAQWDVHQVALGATDDEALIQVAENTAGSSFVEVTSDLTSKYPEMGVTGTEHVIRRRLDSMVRDGIYLKNAFMKLDVQGYEEVALTGAQASLPQIAALEVELSFTPLYAGELPFASMVEVLGSYGYKLAGMIPGTGDPATGLALQVDALFTRAA